MHKISVITVCFNAAEYIEETIQSVVEQKGVEFEYIIVDGLSTDGTVDIIKRYQASIDQWVSETDGGIAEAMNKGIGLATGDYLIFLHADDYFINTDGLS
ncbi:MAG: glycosyltransferase, partial [Cycloclasticus sp.]|nr:glycosyltransferase [Cycloclasticus sp.]